ncbi:cytochrome c3 family protein [Parahaliea mediterranea]|uniref:cytochrome c3 family protein n=1 Tax=Parahaliea mediterranea TaxID=651086 RepID=UPI000C0B188A|nr:cytochrome c3 family protein [Parahaliea mediterranea]MAC33277.1 hypothetical protein [Haliea sp.]|tara:strand:- start:13223 stop:13987 length:765 start_codon:yes stop_codon:yes gene_type:complete
MKLWPYLITAVAIATALFFWVYLGKPHPGGERSSLLEATAWQRMASPGPLSSGHSFLEHDCAACHTTVKGPEAANCIVCHANNQGILATQSTAFHADIGNCRSCHIEHMDSDRQSIPMDHEVLARIAMESIPVNERIQRSNIRLAHSRITEGEAGLDCAGCHSNQDPHRTLFGSDCASCHSTTAWSVPEFSHPSATSTDCAQCHQAPPSHYMGHFKMVSMKVANVMHAEVSQCFLCHKTNDWNDIKGVGWYKHH